MQERQLTCNLTVSELQHCVWWLTDSCSGLGWLQLTLIHEHTRFSHQPACMHDMCSLCKLQYLCMLAGRPCTVHPAVSVAQMLQGHCPVVALRFGSGQHACSQRTASTHSAAARTAAGTALE